jgi:hypothetical protein
MRTNRPIIKTPEMEAAIERIIHESDAAREEGKKRTAKRIRDARRLAIRRDRV